MNGLRDCKKTRIIGEKKDGYQIKQKKLENTLLEKVIPVMGMEPSLLNLEVGVTFLER